MTSGGLFLAGDFVVWFYIFTTFHSNFMSSQFYHRALFTSEIMIDGIKVMDRV